MFPQLSIGQDLVPKKRAGLSSYYGPNPPPWLPNACEHLERITASGQAFAFQTPTSFLKPFPSMTSLPSKPTPGPCAASQSALSDPTGTLSSVMKAVSKATEIALDTEADSMHAYPEKVCLIQIRIGEQSWLLDPLSDHDLGPLMKALSRKTLLFHAADYDLRLLFRRYGLKPCRIFDTKGLTDGRA